MNDVDPKLVTNTNKQYSIPSKTNVLNMNDVDPKLVTNTNKHYSIPSKTNVLNMNDVDLELVTNISSVKNKCEQHQNTTNNKSKKVISIKDKMLKSDWPKSFKDSIKGWIGQKGEFINGFCIYALSQNLTTTK